MDLENKFMLKAMHRRLFGPPIGLVVPLSEAMAVPSALSPRLLKVVSLLCEKESGSRDHHRAITATAAAAVAAGRRVRRFSNIAGRAVNRLKIALAPALL
jgi:hypothetical protein